MAKRVSKENLIEHTSFMFDNTNVLKRNTDYAAGNIVNKGQVFLKCTQSGKTKATTLSLSGVSVGDTLADGTAEWEVVSINGIPQGSSGNGLEDWKPNHSYKESDIFVYDGQIYKALVGFTSGNTFGQIDILEDYTLAGETPISWAEGVEIATNDIVEYDGNYYKALVDFTCGAEFTEVAFEEYVPKELTDIQINDLVDLFNPSGGSGVNVVVDTLWEGQATSTQTLTLTKSYTDYDYIIIYVSSISTGKYYDSAVYAVQQNMDMKVSGSEDGTHSFSWEYSLSFSSGTVSITGASSTPSNTYCISRIEGIKLVNPNVYSTTEQRIGTWIDSKPLYQVTLTGTTPSSTGLNMLVQLISYNINSIINIEGYCDNGYGSIPINADLSNNSWTIVVYPQPYNGVENGVLYVGIAGSDLTSKPFYVTIKYTKTTD